MSGAMLAAVQVAGKTPRGSIVPNAVDFDFFTLPEAPRKREPFTYICVCNLVPLKRAGEVIRALSRLRGREATARLVIVGDGPERDALRQLARLCGVEARVKFTGALEREAVRRELWAANALVVASAFETFGVVLVEALATGLPVLATRCGGPEDILEPGLGILVERADQEALVAGMTAVARGEYEESRLRAEAERRFSYPAVARALLEVYATLVGPTDMRGR